MNNHSNHSSSADSPAYPDQPELALVAVMTLISRYPACGSTAHAEAVVAQLRVIASDVRFPMSIRECAYRLTGLWSGYAQPREAATSPYEQQRMFH